MAINTQKLLPSSQKTVGLNTTSASRDTGLKKPLLNILKKTIKIENILKNTNSNLRKKQEKNRKTIETQRFLNREKKLEETKSNKMMSIDKPNIPGLSIFDKIRRFFFFTFIGWLVKNYWKHLPAILEFGKNLIPVVNFIETFTGNVFNGMVDFIGKGYDLYDKFKQWTKDIGGQPFENAFNNFSKNLNTFVNLAIIAGLAATGGSDFKSKKGGPKGSSGQPRSTGRTNENLRSYLNRGKEAKLVERKFGNSAARYYEELRNSGKNSSQAYNEIKRKFESRGLFNRQNNSGLSGKGRTPGKVTGRGIGRIASRTSTKLFGRMSGKIAGKVLGRIPIIGGLVDFLFALWSGEKVGRAAAKAVGATIGSALGTFIPIPFAGTILGGILGDIVGGALYDTLMSGSNKPKKKAKGGQVTRGGKSISTPIQRTIAQKRVRISPAKPLRAKPGADVGGEKKYQEMFPEPMGDNASEYQNPFGFLYKSSNSMGDIPYVGPLFSIFGKLILGESPKNSDYKNIGYGLKAWINNSLLDRSLNANTIDNLLNQIPVWVEKSSKKLIEQVANTIIDDLKRNLSLKKLTSGDGSPGDLGEGLGVYVSSNSPDFWLLATAAMFENSDPQGAADVAQAIYNRVAMPGDPWNVDNSISKAILNPGQFQPVRQYGGTSAWSRIKTKEDALRFAKSHGKTSEQLETVAAAILDKSKQQSARDFVGPRDSFRAESYEKQVDHLANDTEKTRHGHTFGFEPRGATIGAFRAGKLSAAQVSDTIQGNVKFGSSDFIQGNSGASHGVHFHVGTTKPGEKSGPATAAFNVIKHFLGKKSIYIGRSREFVPQNATDDQIRKIIARGQAAHRQTEIDIQVGGAYGKGNRVAFPLKIKNHRFEKGGYGMKADIVGVNAFVGHGRYTKDGKLASQEGTPLSKDSPDYYFKGGGIIGDPKSRNFSGLRTRPQYSNSSIVFIKPIKEVVYVPINSGRSSSVIFSQGDNAQNQHKSTLFVR